jgi:D-cysteine desulfhydrase
LELSGNKVRKLEYLLYQAKKDKADYVFTCGGDQSNHSRATAVAAKSLGINSKLFLWGKDSLNADGNLFIDKFIGAEIKYLSKKDYADNDFIMQQEKELLERRGKKVFIIPEGGSSELGIWGYINFIDELGAQVNLKKVTGILTACGSGGTTAGLLIGSAIMNLKTKIFAVNVLYPEKVIREKILNLAYSCIEKYKLGCTFSENQLEILDGYSEEGYKHIANTKLELLKSFASSSGIILDPAYTGKAFCAYEENFIRNKAKSGVLFVHTGGIFGVFNKRRQYLSV